ncbi:MAG: phosphoribosylaminoimidazolesuccinocarboxamide synthase [Thermoanaerobaculaceae bacterium]|nr:phosphoribosylaminoimidazolesuccinocarboxamide synthase [Thermoanaerobaculaceae bacterium]
MKKVILRTNYNEVPLLSSGKVRDIYDLGDSLLIVVTDRISAFDFILPNGIPDKGKVLNLISKFWFEKTRDIIESHLISCDTETLPESLKKYSDELKGRFTVAKKAKMFPVECIVRGYISGSAWQEYKKSGTVCGMKLKEGMVESEKFEEPLFTPSTKAESGHDINISFDEMKNIIGSESAEKIKKASLELYNFASSYALERGIIIADTKFEFGLYDGKIILCDEVLTPDSSRFWPLESYEKGKSQPSFDKQYVRDYLLQIGWKKEPPVPSLPDEVVEKTSEKYREAYEKLSGRKLCDE